MAAGSAAADHCVHIIMVIKGKELILPSQISAPRGALNLKVHNTMSSFVLRGGSPLYRMLIPEPSAPLLMRMQVPRRTSASFSIAIWTRHYVNRSNNLTQHEVSITSQIPRVLFSAATYGVPPDCGGNREEQREEASTPLARGFVTPEIEHP